MKAILIIPAFIIPLTACTNTVNGIKIPRSAADFFYSYDDGPWLVLGDNPSEEVRIVWTASGKQADREILFGNNPDALSALPASDKKGRVLFVLIGNLKPGKKYYYAMPSAADSVHQFTLPVPAGPLNFTVVGDMQPKTAISNTGNDIMTAALAGIDTDFFVQLGDVAELGGNLEHWHNSLKHLSGFACDIPVAAVIGNHDYYLDPFGYNFRNFFPRDYVSGNAYYYSLDIGKVHLLFLDTFDKSVKKGMSDKQENWAEQDLKNASMRSEWIFVFMHQTMLVTATSKGNTRLRRWLIPLADRYGVDAVFFGHDHDYEHWYYSYGRDGLVYSDSDLPRRHPVHYFCSGGGGVQSEVEYGLLEHDDITEKREFWNMETQEWVSVENIKTKWDSSKFIDHRDNPRFGHPPDGKHYYQLGGENDYSTENGHYGYQYGEQTLHYISVTADDHTCEISVHYPDGSLLTGPYDNLPQTWIINKE